MKILDWKKDSEEEIGKLIHYPDCWDTMAYPSLASALWEMCIIREHKCPTCKKIICPEREIVMV
jgi:hypothetical protein